MAETYQHTQREPWLLIGFGAVAAIELAVALVATEGAIKWLLVAAAFALVLIGWVFSQLTVVVEDGALSWHFGEGFWKKSLSLSEIVSAHAVRTRWWYGWGIRLTPKGWLYNVSGLDAVEIKTRDGKTVLIGTDEPDKLAAALNA